MTRTIDSARAAASSQLADMTAGTDMDLVLIDSVTEEFDVGWMFYYQSADYVKTGNVQHAVVGNAPLFVPRDDSPPQSMSYHRSVSESLDAYRYCGKVDALPNAEIELVSSADGVQAASAIRAIRECSMLGLGAAKAAVDGCLSGKRTRVPTASIALARELKEKLGKIGFVGTITYGG